MRPMTCLFIFLVTLMPCALHADGNGKVAEGPDLRFVSVPGGSFRMGDVEKYGRNSDERPVHEVTVDTFEMSMYEVTNAQFVEYLNAAISSKDIIVISQDSVVVGTTGLYSGENYFYYGFDYSEIEFTSNRFNVKIGKEDYPVFDITWYGAKAFADYYGYNLPTEAEWEYACRAGTATYFYTGNDIDKKGYASSSLDSAGWYGFNSNTGGSHPWTHTAGQKEPNTFGLYDMHGNVWEWCSDWYDDYTKGSVTNPEGPPVGEYRVVRGGAWSFFAVYCRSAYRFWYYPEDHCMMLGFRVVRRQDR